MLEHVNTDLAAADEQVSGQVALHGELGDAVDSSALLEARWK